MRYIQIVSLILLSFSSWSQSNIDSLIQSVGDSLESSLSNNSTDYLSDVFSDTVFFSKFIQSDQENEKLMELNNGFFNEDVGAILGAEIATQLQQKNYYSFISYTTDTIVNEHTLMFRFFIDGGLNYHQYDLILNEKNNVEIVDVFIFSEGKYFSKIMRQIYLPIFNQIAKEENITPVSNPEETI